MGITTNLTIIAVTLHSIDKTDVPGLQVDPYNILGVPVTATQAEIKAAYRQQAKEHHPDTVGDDPAKRQRFLEVTEAYNLIGTAQKRKLWDLYNLPGVAQPADGGGATAQPGKARSVKEPPPKTASTARRKPKPPPQMEPETAPVATGEPEPAPFKPAKRAGVGDDSRLVLLCVAVAIVTIFVLVTQMTQGDKAASQLRLTPQAIGMLANRALSPMADVVAVTDEGRSRSISYQFKPFTGPAVNGTCAPCPYPAARNIKVGDDIQILWLPEHALTFPLFAVEDLTAVDPVLADRLNALAAQESPAPDAERQPAPR